MLFIVRSILTVIYCILVCVFGCIYCLFSPRNPKHVSTFGRMFGRLAPMYGLKVETRLPEGAENFGNAIYIANHQNNYDMVTAANIVLPPTVTVGKKSLLWVPFFGLLYWLTGNLLIDRNNRAKAHSTIAEVVNHFKKRKISIWMFPEGTRSRGRGLLPFKTGAFHAAIAAGVPIIPVCVSNTSNKINLNRLKNGLVIVEMLPPVDTSKYGKDQVRELAAHCRELMARQIEVLDKEVAEREASGKI
ncbi:MULTISPECIES: 1-acylglycerol-3-phosphate O-acyltransferase [Lelliottia]|jgi:1-acyl-sn-glycerol-3-phosphate acyltransferase|uniref:1-acyl-sn-glycerol-3-phosphate acyltransferase n=1 Tax=Lelliottia wanjuensis TaxID=3050585 RepID=A0AAP4D2F1_9ENTR|nr:MULTISPECIES: 1-acylglycerol-3-phosphate O-acyltransferase [unclassified Lelliottia]MDI3361825.1 1-acylglycerol-3-phosphate O-acyltransferase [Lelliottia sp. V89_13]MDK9354950.1 1-acylglycerol-3-phosphate O-acyltransferase [Lelliottia sp. V106_16]MDK9362738.1 1-acylglycerol-3-phosphate O-acyltransferase [Lelliottia sp. V106_12]MDK9372158.1 1-acylglycerol-3-phosphate O-acyltransferase [Lelliottia sp. V106_10]MDK9550716.1 1-acylglycerol-3-phosphate O-acyltransferase [Lelliottia sp. V89_5]